MVKLSSVIFDFDGNAYASSKSTPGAPPVLLTVREVFINALLAPIRLDMSSETECQYRVALAEEIRDAGSEMEIEETQKECIKTLVNKTNNLPLVVARALEVLKEG